jgi:hypothetical protein
MLRLDDLELRDGPPITLTITAETNEGKSVIASMLDV